MVEIKQCPIQISFYKTSLHKKWTLTIIRDLLLGQKQFSAFLRGSPDLSAKVLSQRLKELENEKLVKRTVFNTTPVRVEYKLTPKGFDLNKILYELSIFGAKHYTKDVFGEEILEVEKAIDIFGGGFKLSDDEMDFHKSPTIIKDNFIDVAVSGD